MGWAVGGAEGLQVPHPPLPDTRVSILSAAQAEHQIHYYLVYSRDPVSVILEVAEESFVPLS